MCGIIGYTGHKRALPILLEGLRRLEYRGYDSAGVALVDEQGVSVTKTAGRIFVLEQKVDTQLPQTHGIGHTRWATHGAPTDINAHPHMDAADRIALIHNGIIENNRALRTYLEQQGVVFRSETDTEVLVQLIAHFYEGDLEQAVRRALHEVTGTYGIAVVASEESGVIVAARKGSPLII